MRKALCIGINNYSISDNLRGCENDAEAMKEVLGFHSDRRRNFVINQPKENIKTKSGLLAEVEHLFYGSSETEIALLYFSGHGGIDSKGNGYLVTSDGKSNEEHVPMHEIMKHVDKSKCQNRIIILDCCHSGAMGNITKTAIINEGVTILSASKSDEPSFDGKEHGVFTGLLLNAFNGGAADLSGFVTAGGAYAYVDRALGASGQRPVFKTNTARFLTLRETEPPIDIEILRKISQYFSNISDTYKLNPSYEHTNIKGGKDRNQEPYALDANVAIFSDLQALNRVGLVVPNCDDLPPKERHMYFAAMESKSCSLTPIGQFYWKLAAENKI